MLTTVRQVRWPQQRRLLSDCGVCVCVRLSEEEEGHRGALEAAKREHEDKLANAVQECLATERVSGLHWLPTVTNGPT